MGYSKELLERVCDGDWHTYLDSVNYSTNLREIITVENMINYHERSMT